MHNTHETRTHQQQRIDHHAHHLHAYDFFNLLTETPLFERVEHHLPPHRERLFPPTDTLALFMAQSLNPDGACQSVVNQHAMDRVANGLQPCSTHTGAYCKARKRLPRDMLSSLPRETGQQITQRTQAHWRGTGCGDRTLLGQDGERTCLVPSTAGQHLGERSDPGGSLRLRVFRDCLDPGASADVLFQQHQRRHTDFRKGRRLGARDPVVAWPKPKIRPGWMTREQYDAFPATLEIREVKIKSRVRVTTLCMA